FHRGGARRAAGGGARTRLCRRGAADGSGGVHGRPGGLCGPGGAACGAAAGGPAAYSSIAGGGLVRRGLCDAGGGGGAFRHLSGRGAGGRDHRSGRRHRAARPADAEGSMSAMSMSAPAAGNRLGLSAIVLIVLALFVLLVL